MFSEPTQHVCILISLDLEVLFHSGDIYIQGKYSHSYHGTSRLTSVGNIGLVNVFHPPTERGADENAEVELPNKFSLL